MTSPVFPSSIACQAFFLWSERNFCCFIWASADFEISIVTMSEKWMMIWIVFIYQWIFQNVTQSFVKSHQEKQKSISIRPKHRNMKANKEKKKKMKKKRTFFNWSAASLTSIRTESGSPPHSSTALDDTCTTLKHFVLFF